MPKVLVLIVTTPDNRPP